MKEWYEIVTPYKKIQSNHIKESIFVADLGNIIQRSAPAEYADPLKFFQQTYLTKGLVNLLNAVYTKLCNGKGNEIIKLQTPFGGGKTHAMIAIYHYVNNGADLNNYLPNDLSQLKIKIVSITGTHINPLEGQTYNNVHIQTIWGDIAYQIAGIEGYNEFKANDMNCISPGKKKISNFLKKHEPILLLFDEIVEYITKAKGISINESNLGTQTLLFLQELTEALTSLSQGLLIISLPVHTFEDFSGTKVNIIKQVNSILGRVETIETPIDRKELYRLISKRLIDEVLLKKERDKVILNYLQIYQQHRNELPEKVCDPSFSERMQDSYPFHPSVIDLLYDKWRVIPSFQGIRAILRILMRVLNDLWFSKQNINLILISNINLSNSAIKNDFLQHIDTQFESIINLDVVGSLSNAGFLNNKHPNWNNLASDISQTIFLSSFPQDETSKGITLNELRFNVFNLQFPFALISEILYQVNQSLHYLHFEDGRYYFCLESNLNRKIQDVKELFQDNFDEELRKEISKHLGNEFEIIIWPLTSNEITDDKKLKVVIVHPSTNKKALKDWIDEKGNTFRINKNTIIFAIPNKSHLTELQDLIQTKLALSDLKTKLARIKSKKYQDSLSEIEQRQDRVINSISFCLRKTYSILFDGKTTITLGLPKIESEPLTKWYHRELISREFIVSQLHHQKLVELLTKSNQVFSTQQILDQYYLDPDLFMIESAEVIQQSICNGVKEGAFGLGELYDNKINTNSFFFSTEINLSQVTFSSKEFIFNKSISKRIMRQLIINPGSKEFLIPDEPDTSSGSELLLGTSSEIQMKTPELQTFSIEVQDIKSESLPAFYRGVLVPLESKKAEISLKIKLDIKSEQESLDTTIDTTIKETINQLGARITKIEKKSSEND